MKRILVPTDLSPNADKALNFAVQLAKQTRGEIFLTYAAESIVQETTDGASEKMALIRKSIGETEPVKITANVFPGSFTQVINDSIEKFDIDLVIMGTIGNAGVHEKIYGSKTSVMIGNSPVPVLVIPLLSDWTIPRKILIAVNDFDLQDSLIGPVLKLAELFVASVQVAVFTDTDDDAVEDYDEHEIKIADFRDMLKAKYGTIEIHAVHLAGRHFMDNLQRWIDNNKIDMLVMLTHKRNIVESIFNRSKTKKMSYHTNIPLMAIPA